MMDSKALRLFRLRYIIVGVIYTLLVVPALFLVYVLIYTTVFPTPKTVDVYYTMEQNECLFEVADIYTYTDMNGVQVQRVWVQGTHGRFLLDSEADIKYLRKGTKYEGYETVYKAYDSQDVVISGYVIRLCEPLAIRRNPLTLEEFKNRVNEDLLKKVIYEYNLEYKSNLALFCFLVLFFTILLLQLKYRKMRVLFLRHVAEVAEQRVNADRTVNK